MNNSNKDGDGNTIKLRFSKSSDESIEKQYATHYIGQQKVDEAKERKKQREVKKISKENVSQEQDT